VTRLRGLGKIMNDPALREYLLADRQGVYDSVHSEVYNGLSGRAASVYETNRVLDSCERLTAGEQRIAFQARAVEASQDKSFALDTIKQKFALTRLINSWRRSITRRTLYPGEMQLPSRPNGKPPSRTNIPGMEPDLRALTGDAADRGKLDEKYGQ
jgi:hypothetical protein